MVPIRERLEWKAWDTLAVLEGSQINANAFQGVGGNINIIAKSVFVSLNSAITASSEFGVSGTVNITNPEVDPSSGLVELPEDVIALNEQVIASCTAAEGNSFTITGSGGLQGSKLKAPVF
ncbi:MAG: S-layer family protein [Symploca sp. SIO2C1]|nr:S-layer family protein [Symploca sp. SIO2C1]